MADHDAHRQLLQARLRALEAELLAVPAASRTLSVRRAYALDLLEGIRQLFALYDTTDNQILRELIEALKAADLGVRNPLFTLEDDLLHCPHTKSTVRQIQAEAAAVLAVAVETGETKESVCARKICKRLEHCGLIKGNGRLYSYWSVIMWGRQCRQDEHEEAAHYRGLVYFLRRNYFSLDEALAFIEPVWSLSLARPSLYPLRFDYYWASRHFIEEMKIGPVEIGRSRRLGRLD